MRKCFLHIGTHKTGTTSIQVVLDRRRDALAAHGFLYPKSGIPDGSAGHHNIAWELRGDRRFTPATGTFDDLMGEAAQSSHDIILSSEDFECSVNNLGHFISRLEQHRLKAQVIVYLRDQISYSRSLYLEMMRHGYPRTLNEFVAEGIDQQEIRWFEWVFPLNYRDLLMQLPPDTAVAVRPFDRKTSVLEDFVSVIGLSAADLQIEPSFRVNEQEPLGEAFIRFYCNRTGRELHEHERMAIKQMIAGTFEGGDFDISSDTKRRLIARFEDSNRWIDLHYGVSLTAEMMRESSRSPPSPGKPHALEDLFSMASLEGADQALGTLADGRAEAIEPP